MFTKRELLLRIFVTISIAVISILGDIGLKYGRTEILRAVFDNVTHAAVGGLTWTLILILSKQSLIRNLNSIFLCFLLSSIIDLDHFLVAKSWKLKDATNLGRRPPLHCTTVPIAVSLFLFLLSTINEATKLQFYSWIILTSFLSHHIRDANRRGLWLFPFGSTPPIPYRIYIGLNMAFPYIVHLCTYYLPMFGVIHENVPMMTI